MNKQKVLILGAGFGGVRAALDLARFGGLAVEVTLVDRNLYHIYTPDLYEVACAAFDENDKFQPARADFYRLEGTAAVPLARIFHCCKNVRLVRDEVTGIDLAASKVSLASGDVLEFNRLIFALGSESAHFDIPGLHGRALNFKTVRDAMNVRNAVCEALSRKPKHETVRITIVGGGFAGVELAAEMRDFLRNGVRTHARPKESFEINIVEAGKEVLGGASARARAFVRRRLDSLKIKVTTGAQIIEALDGKIRFSFSGEEHELAHDILVFTAGVCANRLAGQLGVMTANKGCIVVDNHLRLSGYENVFVIGDANYCIMPGEERPLPMTAQLAIDQGRYVSYTIRRQMYGRRHFPYFPAKSRLIIPLGGQYAVYDGTYFCFAGVIPWALKRLISFYYYLTILPLRYAWRLWRRSVKIYSRNDG